MGKIANLVHQQSTATGTGACALTGVSGRQAFATAFGTGATPNAFYYFISHQTAAEWEIGTGHMSDAATLVRDTVLASSNANAAVNFSVGLKDVVNDLPAARQLEGAGSSADNTLPRFSGTGGDALKTSGVTVDNVNNMAGVLALTVGTTATAGNLTVNTNLNGGMALVSSHASGPGFNLQATVGRTYQFYSNGSSKNFGVYDATINATPLSVYGGVTATTGSCISIPSGGVFAFSSDPQWPTASNVDAGMSRTAAGSFAFGNGTAGNKTATLEAGNIKCAAAGNGLYIKEGANATLGIATLVAGSVTVSTTKVTANSRIQLTVQALGTVTAPKAVAVTARTAATSFTITSADVTDTSSVAWQIIEPA